MADVILRTLHGKLSLILFGLFCLVGCLSVPLTLFTTQRYQQEVDQNLNRPLAASLSAHLAAHGLLSQDPAILPAARAEIKYLMAINPNIGVYLLDNRGAVLTYSCPPGEVRRGRVALTPLLRFLDKSAPLPILGDDPRASHGQKIFSVAKISGGSPRVSGEAPGYVYVILSDHPSRSVAGMLGDSGILRSGVGVLVIILVLVFIAGLLLFRLLTQRLRWLTASMEAFRDLNYNDPDTVLSARLFTPWPGITPPRDEVDRLGLIHLQMTNRIRGQIMALAQADTHRREMVSNVSHDLRTPLSALHGYLETLLMKEGIMTPEEQRKYLQVAIQHSERLSKLVGELFELARLDAREVQINTETFSLGELVQDVVQQYDLVARQKNIRLQALLSDNLPFVSADIALIQRVLDNLLDNALRYTPGDGSVIISLTPHVGKIEVRVADTGIGIRQEDISHIFERFYRVPSQPEKPGCAGLGLAIAKRILELHGSAVQVESALNQGTTFIFRLPTYAPSGA